MKCAAARRQLSGLRDGTLPRAREARLRAHLDSCPSCRGRWDSLTAALDVLAQVPRLEPPESLAAQVLNRLEVERRGPGLALLFRSVWMARPLIWPSLVPAAMVVVAVIAAALALDREPLPDVYVRPGSFAWSAPGTERNPLFAGPEVDGPRQRGLALPAEVLAELSDGTFFVETVVARDGTVSQVNLLEGDRASAKRLMEAMRRQRFEPARYRGQPVAVSMYRLISRLEVRAPLT
ncbi:MAG TPA: zf-HC2 domain-containing protein [Vicinamibacteria bacterium]|nr:zf-HC2 domain-containing protein [Vicinamibacteria bacterium]